MIVHVLEPNNRVGLWIAKGAKEIIILCNRFRWVVYKLHLRKKWKGFSLPLPQAHRGESLISY